MIRRCLARQAAAWLMIGCVGALVVPSPFLPSAVFAATGLSPLAASSPDDGNLASLLSALDADQFEVRAAACRRLLTLAQWPQSSAAVRSACEQALANPAASVEVREAIARVLAGAPMARVPRPAAVSAAQIERWVTELDGDSYRQRCQAAERLAQATTDGVSAARVMAAVKRGLAEATISAGARYEMQSLWQQTRGAWLLAGAPTADLPEVSESQIEHWLDDLTARPFEGFRAQESANRASAAERELLDLLACDRDGTRVTEAVRRRLADQPRSTTAKERLERLDSWTQPALAAEFWYSGHQNHVQHLLVDVPVQVPGAQRASHFDRIDDRVAHCASGNSLSPGDYPVGVLFPHPVQEGAQFRLVNLPTPRRRMAYDFYVRTDESQRLAELTSATLAYLAAEKRPLKPAEILMLSSLERRSVSRFIADCLSEIEDQPEPSLYRIQFTGQYSHHGWLGWVLAERGTSDAAPGLLKAIEARRFLPETIDGAYRLPVVAALSIASRDPWPQVDGWLETLLADRQLLNTTEPAGAEVGASAAALLLTRHAIPLLSFGLESVQDDQLTALGCPAFRFSGPEKPAEVARWWDRHKQQLASNTRH